MSPWAALGWGVLQGLTEFIPVSSSGHLVLVPWLLGLEAPELRFDVVVHAGTLVAVLIAFAPDILALVRGFWQALRARQMNPQARLALLLVVSAIPAGVLGLLLENLVADALGAPIAVALLLLVTGCLLFLSESLGKRERHLDTLTLADTLLIGVSQCLALLPGISRSGATISGGLLRGLRRDEAARFSFLMSIPVIAGAALRTLWGTGNVMGDNALALAIGFFAASLSGYLGLRFLVSMVARHGLRPYAYYCWAFGLLCLVAAVVR